MTDPDRIPPPEESQAAWTATAARLCELAQRRDGTCWHDGNHLVLSPPHGQGEQIKIIRSDHESALLETGLVTRVYLVWTDYDPQLEQVVAGIMDGMAEEIAIVSDDGRWLDAAKVLRYRTAEGAAQIGPSPTLMAPGLASTATPARQFTRQIAPWPAAAE